MRRDDRECGGGRRNTRRSFLRRSGFTAATLAGLPTLTMRRVLGAGERVVMGAIGCGAQGTHDLSALQSAGAGSVAYAAVCDVYDRHTQRARSLHAPRASVCRDFREILDRVDIDAVNIGTPDHWHGRIAIDACRAGKDVYCQKPLSLTISDGRAIVSAARRNRRVFQTGSQQRSSSTFRYACELLRNQRLGKIKHIHTAVGRNKQVGWVPNGDPPSGLDWNFYLGPAKYVPFNRHRFVYDFRWFYDYSGGNLTDWGAHHNDIAQWALGMDESGPIEIDGVGKFPETGVMDTPITFTVKYKYASGVTLTCSSDKDGEPANGCWFYGENGELYVNRGQLRSDPESISEEVLGQSDIHLEESDNHYANFLDCVRTRKRPICDVEIGHRSVTVCHLGNISIRLGRPLRWDPVAERIVDDEEANRWLSRPTRAPW